MTRLRAWLLVAMVVALGAPSAEAAISRGSSISPLLDADRVSADYSLSVPALTDRLRAAAERLEKATACESLCEFAAIVEAHPFGRAVAATPFGTQDAWGNYRFTSELAPSKNRFGFTQHYWDNEAGLYYAKARFYDPFTARFTQADSFLGNIDDPPSLHRYQYANANPTFFVDLTGHAGSDNQARHFGKYRGDPLKPMDVSDAAARSLGSIEATAETGAEMGVGLLFGVGQFARAFVRGGDEMSRFLIDTYDSAHEFASTFGARVDRANEASAQAIDRGDHYEAGRVFTRELVAPTALAAVTIVETGRAGVGALERGSPLKQSSRLRSPADFMAEAERRTQVQRARFGNVEAYASTEAPVGGMTVAQAEAIVAKAETLSGAELRPYRGPGGGHHVPAKGAFTGAACYDCNAALAIPNAELARLNVSHSTVTGAQASAYRAFAKSGQPLTWEVIESIETQALIRGNMKPEAASVTVKEAIQALRDKGVAGPTRIPWGGK